MITKIIGEQRNTSFYIFSLKTKPQAGHATAWHGTATAHLKPYSRKSLFTRTDSYASPHIAPQQDRIRFPVAQVNTSANTDIHVYICTCICMYTYIHIHICVTYIYIYMYTHNYMHVYTCIYT